MVYLKKQTQHSAFVLLLLSMPALAIHLESPLLKIIDNFPAGITPKRIAQMVKTRAITKVMLDGTLMRSSHTKGWYIYCGEPHSVAQLQKIEPKLEEAQKNGTLTKEELAHAQQELAQCLAKAKLDFEEEASQFMEQGRAIRETTMIFIKESCAKRNRPDSFLLNWGTAEEGKEMEDFHKGINSFNDLALFYSDLVKFLEDMIESCPHATAEFKKMVEAERYKQTHHEST